MPTAAALQLRPRRGRPSRRVLTAFALAAGALVAIFTGCVTPTATSTPRVTAGYGQVRALRIASPARLADWERQGPLPYRVTENLVIDLGRAGSVVADDVVPAVAGPTPLVIISHGNQSRKEAHRYQAERLASWGMHALVLQLPARGRWLENGRTIRALVELLQRRSRILGGTIDPRAVVLAGHSFGGSAIAVAAGLGAPVRGLVLLDPAVVDDAVGGYLSRVRQPVMVLGADRQIYRSRKRPLFFRESAGTAAEISVRGATHDDAQSPSMYSLTAFGFDPFTSRQRQQTFTAALAATAFSLAATGSLDWVWPAFRRAESEGGIKNARIRQAREIPPAAISGGTSIRASR